MMAQNVTFVTVTLYFPSVFCAWPLVEYISLDRNQTQIGEKSSNEYFRGFTYNFRGPAKILRSPMKNSHYLSNRSMKFVEKN